MLPVPVFCVLTELMPEKVVEVMTDRLRMHAIPHSKLARQLSAISKLRISGLDLTQLLG